LEDALRTGIVNELFAADEAFLHRYPAPGAEAIGKFRQGCVRDRGHGGIVSEGRESCQPSPQQKRSVSRKIFLMPAARSKKIVV
jgi:hypothetical protein